MDVPGPAAARCIRADDITLSFLAQDQHIVEILADAFVVLWIDEQRPVPVRIPMVYHGGQHDTS